MALDPTLPFAHLANDPVAHLSFVQDMRWYLREQLATLSDAEFWDWMNSQEESDRRDAIALMGEPAFTLRDHQLMPRADQQAYHVKPQERILSFDDWRRQPRVLQYKKNGEPLIWRRWFNRMGRGAGKTHAASCNVHDLARYLYPGLAGILVAPVTADARDVMIEGSSGLINTAPPDFIPVYIPSKLQVVWPNGSYALIRTADDPQQIRGPSISWGWGDELAKWKSPESYKNLNRTIRNKHEAGTRLILTTSPRSSQKWVRDIEAHPSTITSVASSFDNTEGLDETALDDYAHEAESGDRTSREEYYAEWQDETDKLWTVQELDLLVRDKKETATLKDMCEQMDSRLLSIDPGGKRDENGIILLGLKDGKKWVLADFTIPGVKSKLLPHVAQIFADYMKTGDKIVVETNAHQGIDDDLKALIGNAYIIPKQQNKITGGKEARAQRAQQLYENDEVVHFRVMPKLHKQMEDFYEVVADKNASPDRVDALVNGLNWYQDNNTRPSLKVWHISPPTFDF